MRVKRHWVIGLLIAAAVFAAIAAGAGARGSLAQACYEGQDTTKSGPKNGKFVDVFCGPGSATVKFKGTSYTFKNGTCLKDQLEKGGFKLELGSHVGGNVRSKAPHFVIFKPGKVKSLFDNTFTAETGAKQWIDVGGGGRAGDLTINLTSNGGSFKTTFAIYKLGGTIVSSQATVTGTFKCH